jgi:hypothetical protein
LKIRENSGERGDAPRGRSGCGVNRVRFEESLGGCVKEISEKWLATASHFLAFGKLFEAV